jgi:2-C-methyl-D-erythritol 4-phosphate cytidylyltransferase/2-C-methyl-D-erythritol 2,4-cyclodiphosphate synthase
MRDISLILLSAGNSTRFGLPTKKQWLYQEDTPLWNFVANRLKEYYNFAQVVVVGNENELKLMRKFADFTFVKGGRDTRQESLINALEAVDSKFVLVTDVARCCIKEDLVKRLIESAKEGACVVPAIKVSDTVYYDNRPIDREKLLRVQTPQLSCTKTLKSLLKDAKSFSDESSLFFSKNREVIFVEGSIDAHKLTYKDDLKLLSCLKPPINEPKTGFGVDVHPFEENKKMFLCGVEIDSAFGFKAHSDGDVAIHALIDALLGASGLGDIGELFPDTDSRYKNADSKELLKEVVKLIRGVGYDITNCDLTIVAQIPKISPYKEQMSKKLASLLGISQSRLNIKATTAEKLGSIGRAEGVLVYATATLNYYQWERQ